MYVMFNSLKIRILFAMIFIIHPVFAYELSVTNATGENMAIEIYGLVVGNMMDGRGSGKSYFHAGDYKEEVFHNTTIITNAGHLRGPYEIPASHTVQFRFTDMDFVYCFNLGNIKVGTTSNGFSMAPAKIVAVPNEWYNSIFGATKKAGDTVENVGSAIGKLAIVDPEPDTKAIIGAVAAGTMAIGAFTDIIGTVIGASSCKDISFVAVKDKDNVSVNLLTSQVTMHN